MKSKGWNIGQGETLRRRRPRWAGGKALLDVGFNEPQEFIQIAGSRGEDICSVFVFCFVDRLTRIVRHYRVAVSQPGLSGDPE
ncbi:hypothetical protein, partial [Acinetobacter baumannii]|uniref:hypothetical protein n=1 Tax=Acinetobacter baumannii TaxID=470 RepID=UPI0035E158C5